MSGRHVESTLLGPSRGTLGVRDLSRLHALASQNDKVLDEMKQAVRTMDNMKQDFSAQLKLARTQQWSLKQERDFLNEHFRHRVESIVSSFPTEDNLNYLARLRDQDTALREMVNISTTMKAKARQLTILCDQESENLKCNELNLEMLKAKLTRTVPHSSGEVFLPDPIIRAVEESRLAVPIDMILKDSSPLNLPQESRKTNENFDLLIAAHAITKSMRRCVFRKLFFPFFLIERGLLVEGQSDGVMILAKQIDNKIKREAFILMKRWPGFFVGTVRDLLKKRTFARHYTLEPLLGGDIPTASIVYRDDEVEKFKNFLAERNSGFPELFKTADRAINLSCLVQVISSTGYKDGNLFVLASCLGFRKARTVLVSRITKLLNIANPAYKNIETGNSRSGDIFRRAASSSNSSNKLNEQNGQQKSLQRKDEKVKLRHRHEHFHIVMPPEGASEEQILLAVDKMSNDVADSILLSS